MRLFVILMSVVIAAAVLIVYSALLVSTKADVMFGLIKMDLQDKNQIIYMMNGLTIEEMKRAEVQNGLTLSQLAQYLNLKSTYLEKHWIEIRERYMKRGILLNKTGKAETALYNIYLIERKE